MQTINSRTRKITLAVLFLLSLSLFVSCVKTEPIGLKDLNMNEITLDTESAAQHLLTSLTFDDTLVRIDADIADALFGISGLYSSAAAYGSTGATAETVLVLRCGSATDAETAAAKIAAYRDEMADVYADYNMPESEKLRDALLSSYGRYVVYVVSSDSEAAYKAFEAYTVDSLKK